jgi:hypothetical protein
MSSLIIFILSLSLTVTILSLRKLKSSSSSFTRAVGFKNIIKTHYNDYKSALKNENDVISGKGHEIFSILPGEITCFLEEMHETKKSSLKSRLFNYRITPEWKMLRAKMIWIGELTLTFFLFSISLVWIRGLLFQVEIEFNTIVIITALGSSFFISAILIEAFTHQGKSFHPERAFQGKKEILMLKLNNLKKNATLFESKSGSGGYIDPLLSPRLKLLRILSKLSIISLLFLSFFGLISTILEKAATLLIVTHGILTLLLILFMFSMLRTPNQKLENHFLFFLLIPLYQVLTLSENSNLLMTMSISGLSGFLGVISLSLFILNKRVRVNAPDSLDYTPSDYLYKNVVNCLPLFWFYHDVLTNYRFFVSLQGFDFLNPINWIPIIFLVFSLKSFFTFFRGSGNLFLRFLGVGFISKLSKLIPIGLAYLTVFLTYNSYHFAGYLLLLPHSLFLLITQAWSSLKSKNLKNKKSIFSISKDASDKIETLPAMKQQRLNDTVEAIASHMDRDSRTSFKDLEIVRKSKLTAQMKEEKLNTLDMNNLIIKVSNSLREEGFSIVTKEEFPDEISGIHMDFLAIKRVEISEITANLQVILISISDLKGKFCLSQKALYYSPNNQMEATSNKKIMATILGVMQYVRARNVVMHELQYESELFTVVKEKLKIDLRLFRTISNSVNTYLDGKCFYRLIFDTLLVTSGETRFLDWAIPFPLVSKNSLYAVNSNTFSNLVRYLEEKYTYIESFSESQEFIMRSKRSFIRFRRIQNYGILPLLSLEVILGIIIFFFPLRLWFNLMLINSLILGCDCLVCYAYYFRLMSQLVSRSIVPYQKIPLRIEFRNYNLM